MRSDLMAAMAMEACEAAVPYTLLGFLLRRGEAAVLCSDFDPSWSRFMRYYYERGTNALLWIALICVTFLLFGKLARIVMFWVKGNRIPGPPCSSFFGCSNLAVALGSGANLTSYLSKLHEKYGPVVRLWLGPSQLLVSVKDVALIKEMLIKAQDKLPLTGRIYSLAFGRLSLFVSSFEKVKKRRESLAEYMNGKFAERANRSPQKIIDIVMERIDSLMEKGFLDSRSFSQHMAFYILGVTLFGEAFLNWSNAATYEELLMIVAKDGCFWASYKVPPFWKRGYWRYQSLCGRLKHLSKDIVQRSRCNHNSIGQNGQCSCEKTEGIKKTVGREAAVLFDNTLLDNFFDREIEGSLCLKEESLGNILALMFHGCLTTASLIDSILTRLVLRPKLQNQLYSEIIAVREETCELDKDSVQNMQFLLATVYESARLLPAGPLLQRCSLTHDLSLKSSVTIPSGAVIVVPLQLVQLDNSIWGEDACEFNPHRFLSNSTKGTSEVYNDSSGGPFIIQPNKTATFLPFGSGSRACIGQKFAILEISALFASLLQNYEIRLQPGLTTKREPTMVDCVHQLLPNPKIVFMKRSVA
ncbi:cytochrome P450 71A16-like [Typha angustifolia]|uniref:cytochrome P450 71A16-like n=1 Tax=Typha angustifolia TaxID=59011 RepID=UPI003C2B9B0C